MAADGERRLLAGWGRTAPTAAWIRRPAGTCEAAETIRSAQARGVVARGLGRAYGDAAQNAGGLVVDCTALDAIGEIDPGDGSVSVGGGVSLEALARKALREGWLVPVTPGTRYVSIGGAIAADVHGKNHHVDGSFASHVLAIRLLLPTGEVRTIDAAAPDDSALFWATAGGMGLTGIILEAKIRLTKVQTRHMVVDTDRANDLDAVMTLMSSGDACYRYSAAWIDLVTRGTRMGRGVLIRGNHARPEDASGRRCDDSDAYAPRSLKLAALPILSRSLSSLTVRAFNELWFRKAPPHREHELQSLEGFFHPLDGLGEWNRVYGSRGFLQWQCVIPFGQEESLRRIIGVIVDGHVPATLAVLKRLGPADPGPLSFPLSGWTLAVDFPAARGSGLDDQLDRLDGQVIEAGGRLYLAKDSRMRPEHFQAMYPRIDEWRAVQSAVDPAARMTSDLDRRLGLTARAAAALPRIGSQRP